MSSHARLIGATLTHACLAGAMHDKSSMVASSRGLPRAMRTSALKMV
jgi:hypothetical protein